MTNVFPSAVCYGTVYISYISWVAHTSPHNNEHNSFDRTFFYLAPPVEVKFREKRQPFKNNCKARPQCFEQPLKPPTLISILIKGVDFFVG